MESVIDKMNTAEGHLARIEENTGTSASAPWQNRGRGFVKSIVTE